jgi:RimJ/RimL family protein N-acetyltransferase
MTEPEASAARSFAPPDDPADEATSPRPFAPPEPPLAVGMIRLRLPAARDEDAIFEACQDPEIQRWAATPVPYLREHAQGWIEGAEPEWAEARHGALAIVDAADDRFLGAIGLSPQGPHRVEIGFWIVPAARGRGIATEATRLLGRWVLRDLGFDRLELLHLVGNDGSRRVAEKVGFRHEGTLRDYAVVRGEARDVVMYSLLAADLD